MGSNKNNSKITLYARLDDYSVFTMTYYGYTTRQAKKLFAEAVKKENAKMFWSEP